jgi:L-galactose dehydrogenase
MCRLNSIQRNIASLDFKIPDGILAELANAIAPVKNLMWFEGQPENNLPHSKTR